MSQKKKKREAYASNQILYKKNRQAAYRKIFETTSISDDLGPEQVDLFWTKLFTRTDFANPIPDYSQVIGLSVDCLALSDLKWVMPEEVRSCRLPFSSSLGPDGVTVRSSTGSQLELGASCYPVETV